AAERLGDGWRDGQRIEASSLMRALTLEVLASCVFDIDVRLQAEEAGAIVDRVLEDFNARLWRGSRIPVFLPTPGNLGLLAALRRLDRMLNRLIDERRRTLDGRQDLLS